MITVNLTYSERPEDLKYYFDHLFTANDALNENGLPATDGQPVGTINDNIGTKNLIYVGAVNPTLTHSKPKFIDNLGGYIFLANESNVCYESSFSITQDVMEHWHVGILSDFLLFEAFFNVYNAYYLGDQNFSGIRTKGGPDYPGDTTWLAHVEIPKNRAFLIRRVLYKNNDSSNDVREELYFNGIKINQELMTYKKIANYTMALGAITNNSHWGWYFSGYKTKAMSQVDAKIVTDALIRKYGINQDLPVPYVNGLKITKSGTIYTMSYTDFRSIDGVGKDESKAIIRWIILESGPTNSYYMPELDGLMSFDANDYLNYDIINKPIRAELTMPDLLGRQFSIPQSYILNQ